LKVGRAATVQRGEDCTRRNERIGKIIRKLPFADQEMMRSPRPPAVSANEVGTAEATPS